jgi:hypothetical protein
MPAAEAPADGEMVVEAKRPGVNDYLVELAQVDPKAAMDLYRFSQTVSADQRKLVIDQQDALAAAATSVAQMPYAQRRQALMQMAPMLQARGVPMAQIVNFDPTDANLQSIAGQALGVKGILEQRERATDNARADAQLDISRANLGVAQGQLQVARGNLALRGAQAGQGPAPAPAARLPVGEVDKLIKDGEVAQNLADLRGTFDPKFSGAGTGAENFAARLGLNVFNSSGQSADWWQRMQAFDNVVRNQLFGASLTAGEQAAWERTTVTPNMSAARIRANLAEREKLLTTALGRRTKALEGAGYNVAGAAAAVRPQPAASATGGSVIRYDAKGRRVN